MNDVRLYSVCGNVYLLQNCMSRPSQTPGSQLYKLNFGSLIPVKFKLISFFSLCL